MKGNLTSDVRSGNAGLFWRLLLRGRRELGQFKVNIAGNEGDSQRL
ncbi:hypothetical protein GCM10022398_05550 [Acetobacter lovaniensis]|nr:hypothetical protein AA0474_3015 [Acetobacter lovaniensis NRIC 0474]